MKLDDITKRRVVMRIQNSMDILTCEDTSKKVRWFYTFGTFLEFMATRTFSLNYDIDLGVFYEDASEKQLVNLFQTYGYKLTGATRNDTDGKPFNLHFEPIEESIRDTPTLDVFFFYAYGQRRIYTYDIDHEGKEIPTQYLFKVVPRRWLEPTEADLAFTFKGCSPQQRRILNEKTGIWRYDLFDPDGQYTFPVPFRYGTLLDLWYPGWYARQNYKGQSKTLEVIKVKSCKELH
jgi:hypothetical protein